MKQRTAICCLLFFFCISLKLSASPIRVTTVKLPNGLTVWLSEDHSRPQIIGSLVVRIGAKDSPDTGIPHYFEHIMFKGTRRMGTVDYAAEKVYLDSISDAYTRLAGVQDAGERLTIQKQINRLSGQAAKYCIPNEFDRLIAKYGGTGLNAGTSWDYTVYYNTFSPAYIRQWCEINSERMTAPVFRMFQSELETVYEEKNMYSDAMGRDAMERLIDRVAAPHPYRYPILGSTESLKNPNLAKMADFYKCHYVAGNMGLILCGDFKTNELIPVLKETFGRLPAGNSPRPVCEKPKPFNGVERFDVKFPIPFIKATALVWHGVPSGHPDEPALQLTLKLLSNSAGTGLLDSLTKTRKLLFATAVGLNLDDAGVLALPAIPKFPFQTYRSAQNLLLSSVSRIRDGQFSQEVFACLKMEMYRDYLRSIETASGRNAVLVSLFSSGQTWADYEEMLRRFDALTKQDVVAVAQKYFGADFLDVRKRTGKYPKEKLNKPPFTPVVPPNRSARSEFAGMLDTIPISPTPLRTLDSLMQAPAVHLAGNTLVNLYVTPNPINNLYSLTVSYNVGTDSLPALACIPGYLDYAGGGGMSQLDFRRALQRIGSEVSFSADHRSFRIMLSGFEDSLPKAIDILRSYLAGIDADKSVMKTLLGAKRINDRALRRSPETIVQAVKEWVVYGKNSSYIKQIGIKTVKKLKPEDLISTLRTAMRTACDIHFVGRTTTSFIEKEVAHGFSICDIDRRSQPYNFNSGVRYAKPVIFFYDAPDARQSSITAYMDLRDLSRRYGVNTPLLLQAYNAYLGGGMSSLLFQEIREFRSLAYSTGSSMLPATPAAAKDEAIFCARLGTQADKTTEAVLLLDSLLKLAPVDSARIAEAGQELRNGSYRAYPSMRRLTEQVAEYKYAGFKRDPQGDILRISDEISGTILTDLHRSMHEASPIVYVIVGNKKKIDFSKLSRLGEVECLRFKDVLPL